MRASTSGAVALLMLGAIAAGACGDDSAKPNAPAGGDAGSEGGPSGPLSLAPGEVGEIVVVDGRAQGTFADVGAASYVVVVASTAASSTPIYGYSIGLEADGEDTGASKVEGCALAAWAGPKAAAETEPTGPAPTLGATRSIDMSSGIGVETITVKAAAVGKRAVVWVDETPAHPATLEQTFIDEFLTDFEETILPRERALFGMESDVDGDGRIALVFSPLTNQSAVAFFSGCDLKKLAGCGDGNGGEFLYLTPPANIDPPYNTPAAIKETLAHELGHLIHFNRKVLKNQLPTWPDGAYMIEGFGGFTQDVVGFQAGNFYVAQAGLEKIDDFSAADVFGSADNYDTKRDGVLRGGGYWLVRYLYDRGGGDALGASGIEDRGGPSFIRALLDSPKSISEGVAERAALADVTADFYTALALANGKKSGLTDPLNPCFSFAPTSVDPQTGRTRGGDPRGEFHGQKLTGPATRKLASADGKLRSGGVEYLSFDAAPGAGVTVRVAIEGAAAAARVRVARVK